MRDRDTLSVFMDEHLVGCLYNETPLAFAYDTAWLDSPAPAPINPTIPLQTGKIHSPYIHAFFENLLPEGDQRKIISMRHHVSTIFGLLATVGGDTAGSIQLLPVGQLPQKPTYRALTWDQVDQLMHSGKKKKFENDLIKSRLSLSGAQYKILLSLDSDGAPMLPLASSPSTHILKPDIVRGDINIFASAVNETIVMRTAHLCELPTAEVNYQPQTRACLIKRYDRHQSTDGKFQRLWQADFCQLTGKNSEVKYEIDTGPSFKECFDLLRTLSIRPAMDQKNLLSWLFFNLYVGNNDSHAKNLSMLSTTEGLRLAPFYDLMSTRVYTGLAPHFSFQIGGEYAPGKLRNAHLETLANSIGVNTLYLQKIAKEMLEQVEHAIPLAAREIMPMLPHSENIMAERIQQKITSLIRKMRKQLF